MFKFKYILSFSFLVFSSSHLFPNLLPGNVVQVCRDKYSFVGDLVQNQLIATLDERIPDRFTRTHLDNISIKEAFSDRAMLIELKSTNGDVGLLVIGEDQYFHRQGVMEKLRPKLLMYVKRNKKKLLNILLRALWVKAKDLKVGDKLEGLHDQTLIVTRVEPIKFKQNIDFYELSLKHHHTFYLIDTAGNHILTHNILPGSDIGVMIMINSGKYIAVKIIIPFCRKYLVSKTLQSIIERCVNSNNSNDEENNGPDLETSSYDLPNMEDIDTEDTE